MSDTPRYAYDAVPPTSHGGHVELPKRTPPKGGYPPKPEYRFGNPGYNGWKTSSQKKNEKSLREGGLDSKCSICHESAIASRGNAFHEKMCSPCYKEYAFIKKQQRLAKDHAPCIICGGQVLITHSASLAHYMNQVKTCSQKCAYAARIKTMKRKNWGEV